MGPASGPFNSTTETLNDAWVRSLPVALAINDIIFSLAIVSACHTEKGGCKWAAEMEHFYKDHRIEVSVWLGNDGWFVSLYVYYRVERTNTLVTFSLKETFTTYDQAVNAGLAAAQRWIDQDKANLNT